MSAMLEVKGLEVSYGKIKAVKGITFDVNEGEVVTLIGTNGAGKTTTLRTISGLLRPAAGRSSPEMVRSVVVLPAPLVPIRVTTSPSCTSKEMPLTALILP